MAHLAPFPGWLRRPILIVVLTTVVAACAGGPLARGDAGEAPDIPISVTERPGDDITRPERRPGARSEAGADRLVAAGPGNAGARAAGGLLGETLAGLGAPGERGLWLRTGLVQSAQRGRVETETGASLTLELRPSGREPGSGSHLSLEAMQGLGLPLTELATLRVLSAR